MIGRVMSILVSLFAQFCVATIIAEAILLGMAWSGGHLNRGAVVQIMSILHGVDLLSMRDAAKTKRLGPSTQQVSLHELALARAEKLRDLELREQALQRGLDTLDARTLALVDATAEFDSVRTAFNQSLEKMRNGAIEEGEEKVRAIIGGIKPKQAKQLLVEMLKEGHSDEVVSLLASIPLARKTKIIAEFKTEEESKQITELLQQMRENASQVTLIDNAISEENPPNETGP